MPVETISAERPERVLVVARNGASDVWLRAGIERDTADGGPDGTEVTFWRAEEVHLRVPGELTAAEVEADFGGWWARALDACKMDAERVVELTEELADANEQLADAVGAIEELAALCADQEAAADEQAAAIEELAAIVAGEE